VRIDPGRRAYSWVSITNGERGSGCAAGLGVVPGMIPLSSFDGNPS
jgi:hypothetical protein